MTYEKAFQELQIEKKLEEMARQLAQCVTETETDIEIHVGLNDYSGTAYTPQVRIFIRWGEGVKGISLLTVPVNEEGAMIGAFRQIRELAEKEKAESEKAEEKPQMKAGLMWRENTEIS